MKKTKRKLPIQVFLAAGFVSVTLIFLIILWLFQTVFLEQTYKSIKTTQMKNCANSVVNHIKDSDVDSLISDIQNQNFMSVNIYEVSSDGLTNIFSSDFLPNMFSSVKLDDAYTYFEKAYDNGGEIIIDMQERDISRYNYFDDMLNNYEDNPPDKPLLDREKLHNLLYATIKNDGKNNYFITVESEITPVASVVQTLRIQLILITSVVIVISIILAIFIARALTKPIKDTSNKAKKLAQQDYNQQFSESNFKEIDELNNTLNYATNELKKVDTLRKDLIANVSHDLRTPLTMINGYAEVMRDLPGENTPENLQVIIDESNRLSQLVSDLLDISKIDSGNIELNKTYFSITECIEDILKRYQSLTETENIEIEFIKDETVYVEADELKISQVIYNLINNAINYRGEDNKIIIRQTIVNDFVKVEVIDHGKGISEKDLPYIWDRYYKVEKDHKRAKIGTGLGLSIVKNVLRAHGADFGVSSELEKGSDFYFSLPVAKENM